MRCFRMVGDAGPRVYLLTRTLDRHARMAGKTAGTLPVVDADVSKPSALPTPDSYKFFTEWEGKSNWKNEVTVKS